MKLLFDENLSHKLVRLLVDVFPASVPVRDVGLKSADDLEGLEIRAGQLIYYLFEGFRSASTKFSVGLPSEGCVGAIR